MSEPESAREFIAYQLHEQPIAMSISSASLERDWMEQAPQRFPYRCLPLNIANQNGWVIACPARFRVYWYGGSLTQDLQLEFDGTPDPLVSSHFGSAVLTFSMPYLFRTPPGINLWVKGPSNHIKDGIQALEGIVETDWATSTFTMNWKMTRQNEWITFERGEPICMLVPIPRGLTESLRPHLRQLQSNPELQEQYLRWEQGRRGFLQGLSDRDPEAVKRGWQKDYFQGKLNEAGTFDGHQTKLNLREFESGG